MANDEKILKLLDELKRLMVLDLVDRGVQGKRIAEVLDVDPAVVSRLVSPRRSKKK